MQQDINIINLMKNLSNNNKNKNTVNKEEITLEPCVGIPYALPIGSNWESDVLLNDPRVIMTEEEAKLFHEEIENNAIMHMQMNIENNYNINLDDNNNNNNEILEPLEPMEVKEWEDKYGPYVVDHKKIYVEGIWNTFPKELTKWEEQTKLNATQRLYRQWENVQGNGLFHDRNCNYRTVPLKEEEIKDLEKCKEGNSVPSLIQKLNINIENNLMEEVDNIRKEKIDIDKAIKSLDNYRKTHYKILNLFPHFIIQIELGYQEMIKRRESIKQLIKTKMDILNNVMKSTDKDIKKIKKVKKVQELMKELDEEMRDLRFKLNNKSTEYETLGNKNNNLKAIILDLKRMGSIEKKLNKEAEELFERVKNYIKNGKELSNEILPPMKKRRLQ